MVDQGIARKPPNPDVGQWLERRQSALRISTTTTTPDGQTLDWVPRESQSGGEIPEPPPAVVHDIKTDQAQIPGDQVRPTTLVQFDTGEALPATSRFCGLT